MTSDETIGTKTRILTKKNEIAGYRRIEIELRAQIESGHWPVGTMLPSRRALAQQYSVSLATLDRAIGPLLSDGTLRADDRRGTFVLKIPELSRKANGRRQTSPARQTAGVDEGTFGTGTVSGQIGIITAHSGAVGQEALVVQELERILFQRGLSVCAAGIIQAEASARDLSETVRLLRQEEMTALIVVCFSIDSVHLTAQLEKTDFGSIPVVCIAPGELNVAVPHVFFDNRSGGYQAAHHLQERGWRDITVVAPFGATWVSERIAGVLDDAAQGFAAPYQVRILASESVEWNVFQDPYPFGYQTAKAAFAEGWVPSGVIGINDGVAIGVIDAAAEQGLQAGRDFGVIGFDDTVEARPRRLTSLRPPIQGMAREATRLLMDRLQGIGTSLQVRLHAHIISRASTRDRQLPSS